MGVARKLGGMVKKYVRAKRVNNCPRVSCGKVGNYATAAAEIDALVAFPFLNVPSHVTRLREQTKSLHSKGCWS